VPSVSRSDSASRRAKENPNVRGVQVHYARRNGIPFHGLIDRGKDDDVLGDMHDGAATGEIGDNFILAVLVLRETRKGYREAQKQKQ
jgi:hypothetical protein